MKGGVKMTTIEAVRPHEMTLNPFDKLKGEVERIALQVDNDCASQAAGGRDIRERVAGFIGEIEGLPEYLPVGPNFFLNTKVSSLGKGKGRPESQESLYQIWFTHRNLILRSISIAGGRL